MLQVGSGAGIDSVTSYHPTLKPYNKASTVSLDLGLSSPSARVPILIAVPAMAEVDLTSVATTGALSAHASILAPLQHDVDVLKREINDLSTVVGSLIKEIKDLKQAKVETVGGVFFLPYRLTPRHFRLRSRRSIHPLLSRSSISSPFAWWCTI